MKKQVLLFVTVYMVTLSAFAQFSFVHISVHARVKHSNFE